MNEADRGMILKHLNRHDLQVLVADHGQIFVYCSRTPLMSKHFLLVQPCTEILLNKTSPTAKFLYAKTGIHGQWDQGTRFHQNLLGGEAVKLVDAKFVECESYSGSLAGLGDSGTPCPSEPHLKQ